ncbi:MAG: hypothetical protein J6J33_06510, partial [Clostridia bacterium]|nr:hypothetical protein [Clostridia bacterium]
PVNKLYNNNIDFINHNNSEDIPSVKQILEALSNIKVIKKQIAKSKLSPEDLYYQLLKTTAYITFDNELKSTFEEGKFVNFVVLKEGTDILDFEIEEVYLEGEPQIKKDN